MLKNVYWTCLKMKWEPTIAEILLKNVYWACLKIKWEPTIAEIVLPTSTIEKYIV